MSNSKAEVIEAVQQMSDGLATPEIVVSLMRQFGPPEQDDDSLTPEEREEAWVEEINRRMADIESGRMKCIPAEEVFRRLDEKLAQRKGGPS